MQGGVEQIERPRAIAGDRHPTIWFEVEDFMRYFDHFRNPTGSQRVPFEMFVEAERLYGDSGRVRCCRLSVYTKRFKPIGFDEVIAAYLNPPGASAPWTTLWEPARLARGELHLFVIARHLGFFIRISKTAVRDVVDAVFRRRAFASSVRAGDIVVSLGASWGVPGHMEHVVDAKRRYGIAFAILIYDLIPIENPSLVEQQHASQFRNWLSQAIAHADLLLTISRHARDA